MACDSSDSSSNDFLSCCSGSIILIAALQKQISLGGFRSESFQMMRGWNKRNIGKIEKALTQRGFEKGLSNKSE
jgi:hypothetical protein